MGYHTCIALFLGELSNPFNILRKNYALEGRDDKVMTMNYLFIAIFLICRVIICPIFVKSVHYSDDMWDPLPFKLFAGAMWMISLIWSLMIFNLSAKQLSAVSFTYNSLISRELEKPTFPRLLQFHESH
jgi:hypothetical protein